MKAEDMERTARRAIRLLRKKKLSQGFPFMINSDMLDSHQCFLEYPDGLIKIVEADSKRIDFRIVFEFSKKDSDSLRKKFGLPKFAQ
jgi:hypothetical protein